MRVLLIIPAYNEAENIEDTINQVTSFADGLDYNLDYLIINDGSSDSTLEVCRRNNFHVASHACNMGIGGAVQTGYKYALSKDYDIAVQFDGDGQHDIRSLMDILKAMENADFVIGSRYVSDMDNFKSTAMRRTGIKILSFLIYLTTGRRIADCTSGYRASNRAVIELFANDYPQDYPEPESIVQLAKKGYRIAEVPAKMKERKCGQSSIRSWKSVMYMIKVSLAILLAGMGRNEGCK